MIIHYTGPSLRLKGRYSRTGSVLFEVNTHSVPTADHFFRVEWTAAFPLWTLNLAQRDTVHGARCVVLHGARIYSCTIYSSTRILLDL